MNSRVIPIVCVLLGVGLPAISPAQTPVPNIPQKITMPWLASLKLSPTTVVAGVDVTGTITLLRPALSNLTVGLGLSGANPIEGGILAADGAIMQSSVTVPVGSDHATFKITTAKPTGTAGSKTFTVTGSYAAERVTATFTITPLVKPKLPQ